MDRRTFLTLSAAALAAGSPRSGHAARLTLAVARSPNCGCCGAWVDCMRDAGFDAVVTEMQDAARYDLKARLGLHRDMWSCHTARIGGYLVEGHVPAGDIRRLLAERPAAFGLAVPGMPAGSPGMETGGRADPYETLLLELDGSATVFAAHR